MNKKPSKLSREERAQVVARIAEEDKLIELGDSVDYVHTIEPQIIKSTIGFNIGEGTKGIDLRQLLKSEGVKPIVIDKAVEIAESNSDFEVAGINSRGDAVTVKRKKGIIESEHDIRTEQRKDTIKIPVKLVKIDAVKPLELSWLGKQAKNIKDAIQWIGNFLWLILLILAIIVYLYFRFKK